MKIKSVEFHAQSLRPLPPHKKKKYNKINNLTRTFELSAYQLPDSLLL